MGLKARRESKPSSVVHLLHLLVHFGRLGFCAGAQSPFLLHEEPTESFAFPPLVVQRMLVQCWHWTEVWEWEKMVLMLWHWLQRTSKKKELGACTSFLSLCMCSSAIGSAFKRSISILTSVGLGKYLIINTPSPFHPSHLFFTLKSTLNSSLLNQTQTSCQIQSNSLHITH